MFANLIESASHQQDLARKGRFFLATLIGYALVVAGAGLMSIYAYDTHVAVNQDLEFLGLVPPIVEEQRQPEAKNAGPKAKNNQQKYTPPQRIDAIDRIADATKIPDTISAVKNPVPEIPKGYYEIGNTNTEGTTIGSPDGVPNGTSNGETGPVVKIETTPPPVKVTPPDPPTPKVLKKTHVLNGDAIELPKPPYPILAKKTGVQGSVSVQIMIDESGKIISARAASGHMMLRSAAEQAAYRARFNPTRLNGVPVKVTGIITYNFSLQ
jgi:protein TonB